MTHSTPNKPSEQILALYNILPSIIEHFGTIDRADLLRTMLDATLHEYETVSTRLQNVKAEIVHADAAYQSKHHLINDEAAERLRAAHRELAQARAELSSKQQGE